MLQEQAEGAWKKTHQPGVILWVLPVVFALDTKPYTLLGHLHGGIWSQIVISQRCLSRLSSYIFLRLISSFGQQRRRGSTSPQMAQQTKIGKNKATERKYSKDRLRHGQGICPIWHRPPSPADLVSASSHTAPPPLSRVTGDGFFSCANRAS